MPVIMTAHWGTQADETPVNTLELTAQGYGKRTLSITHMNPGEGAEFLHEPQFLPVTNVRGDEAVVKKFFEAPYGKPMKIQLIMNADGGEDMVLNSVEFTEKPGDEE